MVKIEDEWLRAGDVNDGDVVTILDEGQYRSAEETSWGRKSFDILIRLPHGQTKRWTMNKTTVNRLAKAFGYETANWIRKDVTIQKKIQDVRGQEREVLYGYPVQESLDAERTRNDIVEKTANWTETDRETYIRYLKDTGQL